MTTAYRRGIETAEIELAQADVQIGEGASYVPRGKQPPRTVSWKEWFGNIEWGQLFWVVLGLTILYAICLVMSFGIIELAEHVRRQDYRILPQEFYGGFVSGAFPPLLQGETSYPVGFDTPWNDTLF